ncbi:Dabb family protein [Pelagicoccus mobilis]|uniref:Dabb family protein n=1 Tax=Pelagicoccus mobilis TaxID=415221 RepID=A0A934S1J8_9BACT|nr:Dabb family protein [Pelagicoccus mobilis]MBK1880661.1 Dabb family protein [Pelagicoccus mobilis]
MDQPTPTKVLRHVVLFKFSDGVTPEDVREIESAFIALPGKIPQILDFEWGTDVSVEGKADGFTHCFFVSFASDEDRAVYLPHPEHKKFGQILRKNDRLDKVLVFDYWACS